MERGGKWATIYNDPTLGDFLIPQDQNGTRDLAPAVGGVMLQIN
jgi:hypothetical protein